MRFLILQKSRKQEKENVYQKVVITRRVHLFVLSTNNFLDDDSDQSEGEREAQQQRAARKKKFLRLTKRFKADSSKETFALLEEQGWFEPLSFEGLYLQTFHSKDRIKDCMDTVCTNESGPAPKGGSRAAIGVFVRDAIRVFETSHNLKVEKLEDTPLLSTSTTSQSHSRKSKKTELLAAETPKSTTVADKIAAWSHKVADATNARLRDRRSQEGKDVSNILEKELFAPLKSEIHFMVEEDKVHKLQLWILGQSRTHINLS